MGEQPSSRPKIRAARHARAYGNGKLVAAGIRSFESALRDLLGRAPAVKAMDGNRGSSLERSLAVHVLRAAARAACGDTAVLSRLRLFDDAFCGVASAELPALDITEKGEPEELGELLESLLSLVVEEKKGRLRFLPSQQRKQRGMFFTPRAVVDAVARQAVAPWFDARRALPRICDPSLGGGAFLLGAARALQGARYGVEVGVEGGVAARREIALGLYGFDIEPLAIAVTEAALAFWAAMGPSELAQLQQQLRVVDALTVATDDKFDLVIGNPPWVAYAGRATQPLEEGRRKWLAQGYSAFRGYPTLHACFVELGARFTPEGRVALLVPSPLADLDGYRPMRRVLTRTHRLCPELFEYGQDAFEGVVQPCFALIADAEPGAVESDAPFPLVERSGVSATAERVEPPACLGRLSCLERLPAECFREFGLQTTREVTETMLRRGSPNPPFVFPLLEGRDVSEFRVGEARLFLHPDRERLKLLQCRLREPKEFERVEFLIRQTAKYTIAALHNGQPFRNSLLAGFGCERYPAAVLVGLLNSTLVRAMHLAAQRDARQKTFPQVKVAHLRSIPAPPYEAHYAAELSALVGESSGTLDATQRGRLDELVYRWYGLSSEEACTVQHFFASRA